MEGSEFQRVVWDKRFLPEVWKTYANVLGAPIVTLVLLAYVLGTALSVGATLWSGRREWVCKRALRSKA